MMDDFDLSEWDDFDGDMFAGNEDMGEGAYVKREMLNFRPIYSIYDLDGQLLGRVNTRHEAYLMIRRNDLVPYDVH